MWRLQAACSRRGVLASTTVLCLGRLGSPFRRSSMPNIRVYIANGLGRSASNAQLEEIDTSLSADHGDSAPSIMQPSERVRFLTSSVVVADLPSSAFSRDFSRSSLTFTAGSPNGSIRFTLQNLSKFGHRSARVCRTKQKAESRIVVELIIYIMVCYCSSRTPWR